MSNYNFSPTSRYYDVATTTFTTPDGERFVCLTRRLLPDSAGFALLHWHTVVAGERLDLVAASELGDSEAFWRIADANDAMHPEDLVATLGRRLAITLPEGIPAPPSA